MGHGMIYLYFSLAPDGSPRDLAVYNPSRGAIGAVAACCRCLNHSLDIVHSIVALT